eukprot:gene35429-45910_t
MAAYQTHGNDSSLLFLLVDLIEARDDDARLYSIAVLKPLNSEWHIRLEYVDNQLIQVMSANFIFIHLPVEMISNTNAVIQNLRNQLQWTTTEEELRIERWSLLNGVCVLHFSRTTIAFFNAILQAAVQLGLRPFPNYCMLGLSIPQPLGGGPNEINMSQRINTPQQYLDHLAAAVSAPLIKIGVIEKGFYRHANLAHAIYHPEPERTGADHSDREHGTHVAGIIGATPDRVSPMQGLCTSDQIELHLFTLMPLSLQNGTTPAPNANISAELLLLLSQWANRVSNTPFFKGLLDCFQQCSDLDISLINMSLEWYEENFNKQYTENLLDGFARVIQDRNFHIVIAAGNNKRNLDYFQTNQPGNSNVINVDVFSSLASRLPEQVTLISASDVNGNHWEDPNFGANVGSNFGSMVALAAPGEKILSTSAVYGASLPLTYAHINYGLNTGTSQAAPHVTGAMAAMKIFHPRMSFYAISSQFKSTADAIVTPVAVDPPITSMNPPPNARRLNLNQAWF